MIFNFPHLGEQAKGAKTITLLSFNFEVKCAVNLGEINQDLSICTWISSHLINIRNKNCYDMEI